LLADEARVELERGAAVGRFVVLGLLGRGGMGEVYSAFDPELDRKVAVKILQSRSPDGEARLLREAKTVAKLQHPNVIVVYEVGRVRDTVFIAMEFVDGGTLGAWLRTERRSWRDVLRVFQAAGRGLAAAHDVGIIHRDFKPENVMLTKGGEVRVMDFGLARSFDSVEEEKVGAPPGVSPTVGDAKLGDTDSTRALAGYAAQVAPDSTSEKLTRTGILLGTPAYMAPEQYLGGRIDARTDQFSFCVSLYEALYGERPFAGETLSSLAVNVAEGRVRPPPDRSRVPGWLRRVLLRGLAPTPEGRFRSMNELLAALDADPAARRRRWLATAAGAAIIATFAVLASRGSGARGRVCGSGADLLNGVWEAGSGPSSRKESIKTAFLATKAPFAGKAYATVTRLLDDYVRRWSSMYQENCEATRVRGDQSEEVLDLRMSCLSNRLANVRALTDVFIEADTGVVTNATSAAASLPQIDSCADIPALRAVVRPPENPDTRRRVGELRQELARVQSTGDSGKCKLAEQRGAALIDAIRPTNYHPLLGEALWVVGALGDQCAEADLSVARLKEAYLEAATGRDEETAAEAAATLTLQLMNRLGQAAAAQDWFLMTRASAARLSDPDRIKGQMVNAEAYALLGKRDYAGFAAKMSEAAIFTAKRLGPDHPMALAGLLNVGDGLSTAGRYDEAVAADEAALSSIRRVLGDEHPLAAMTSSNECEALNFLHRYGDALLACKEATRIWAVVQPEPIIRSITGTQLGISLIGVGRSRDAVPPLEEAVAGLAESHAGSKYQGDARFALARALWSLPSQRPRALALAREARTDYGTDAQAIARIDAWSAGPR
jgi:predicted Ser/Thr protein kinase